MTALEQQTRFAWEAWGAYAKRTFCAGCGELLYCRAKRKRFLCLACFDQEGVK